VRAVWADLRAAAAPGAAPAVLWIAMSGGGARRAAEGEGGRPRGAGSPFRGSDDDLIEEVINRIVDETRALPKACRWCLVTLSDDGPFCSSYCAEEYSRKLMPAPNLEHAGMSRPASPQAMAAFHRAGVAGSAKRRWLAAHPFEVS